jgi:DNA polymerase
MTDILATLDAVIAQIGESRHPQFPLLPSAAPARSGTGTSKSLKNKGVLAVPVLPVENQAIHAGIERTASNNPDASDGHSGIAPEEYTFKNTGSTGSTGSPEGFCGSQGSRAVIVDGRNGKTDVASRDATTLKQGAACLSEYALFIDFKIRSALDLEKVGASACVEHWSTEVWVACYAIGNGPVQIWRPGSRAPMDLTAHVCAGGPIVVPEASFERAIWSKILAPRHGWPEPRVEQWHCIAALSAAMALPRKLEEAAKVVGLSFEQGLLDNQLIRRLGAPRVLREIPCALCGAGVAQRPASPNCLCNKDPRCRTELVWLEDREIVARGIDYCIRALETARKLLAKLQPLPAFERQIWLLDQRINERGVSIDIDLARIAHRIVEDRQKKLNAQLTNITEGAVGSATQIVKLLDWLRSNGVTPPGGAGSNKLGKEEIRSLLQQRDLPDKCRRALEIRAEAAKTSTTKLDAFINRTSADGRLRDSLVYRGAGRTGRWSGKGAQLQNLPRPPTNFAPSDIKCALELIGLGWTIGDIGKLMPAQGLEIISACLRPLLIADPGDDLIAADYNAIEARGVAWLAGADRMLGIFARGEDPYVDMAAQIYGAPADSFSKTGPERQLSKAAVLGLGYQMGAKTFKETCEKQGVIVTDHLIQRAVQIYREMNPEIRNLWGELEDAAIEAVRNEGHPVWCARGRIGFGKKRRLAGYEAA